MKPTSQRAAAGAPAPDGLPDTTSPNPAASSNRSLQRLLTGTWVGRILIVSLGVRLLTMVISGESGPSGILAALDRVAALGLAAGLVVLLVRLGVAVKRRFLWRVRRRLILSYVFIGVVPVLLVLAFFLFGGLLLFFNISSFLFKSGFDALVHEAMAAAKTAAVEIRHVDADGHRELLERRIERLADRYPGISLALMPAGPPDGPAVDAVAAGPWRHTEAPTGVPAWIGVSDFGGLLAITDSGTGAGSGLVIRAVGVPDEPPARLAVIVDVPIDDTVVAHLSEATGIELGHVGVVPIGGTDVRLVRDGGGEVTDTLVFREGDGNGRYLFNWVTFFDYYDWDTGATGRVSMATRVAIGDIYARISAAQSRLGSVSLGELFLLALAVIAALFLIIEIVALATGLALARSITSSIHALFQGTARVRQGDFTHRIAVRTRDQLGELADSFNAMTASVEHLLEQAAEKRRMEEELRIARDIQVSLLPKGRLEMPGVHITAVCDPAREVGGDYYDFFPLVGGRLGVLIADVAGKGTSAALYMAELKGIVLSLSRLIDSPRDLLIAVNRTISGNLDNRSFITMTYAVIDPAARAMTYVRAGHTPVIALPAGQTGRPAARTLTPNGLVVGLSLDGIDRKFGELLQEARLTIATGDLFVLFTDGLTEAMNSESELFGEARLLSLVEEHGHRPAEELRERILREVEAFVGDAERHDDMTMLLIRIGELDAIEATREAVPALEQRT